MTIYMMDRDFIALRNYEDFLKHMDIKLFTRFFTSANQLWEGVQERMPDLIFAELDAFNSVPIIEKIRKINPKQRIVLVSATEKIPPEVVEMHLCGVLLKPVTEEALEKLISQLRHPIFARMRGK